MPAGGTVIITGGPAPASSLTSTAAASYGATLPLQQGRATSYAAGLQLTGDAAASYGADLELAALSAECASSYAVALPLVGGAAGSYGALTILQQDAAASYGAALALSQVHAGSYGADLLDPPYILWSLEPEDLTDPVLLVHGETIVAEAKVRVNTSTSSVNEGFALSVLDGTVQFTLWARADGFNLQGGSHVTVDLSDRFHTLMLKCQGGTCKAYVDGNLMAYGLPAGATDKRAVTFGTFALATW